MNHPINCDYTDEQRLVFAEAILCAADFLAMKKAIDRWNCFVPFLPRPMLDAEDEVHYVEALHDQLRTYASEWATHCRITALEARIEELEQPNGGRMGDHR
jgi:hypothetical protein